jgi:outer membrane protein TolC
MPQLVVARAEVEKARANLTTALTPFLPSVSLTFVDERFIPRNGGTPVTVVGNQVIGGTSNYSGYASLGLSWNFFNSGKDTAGYHGAKAAVRSSKAGLESQLDDTLEGVLQAYGDLFDAQRSVLEQRRILSLLQEIQGRAEERFRNGHGTTIAVEQASSKVLESERSLYDGCRAVADKSAALAKAAGMRLPASLRFAPGGTTPMIEVADGDQNRYAIDTLLERDPAVVAAREAVTVAEAKLSQAKSAFGPSAQLFAARDYLGQDPGSLAAANRDIAPNSYRFGIQVQQPLLPFTSETGAVRSAHADLREARAKYDQAMLDTQARLEEAWSAREQAVASAAAAREAVHASQRILDLTDSVYRAGRTDLDNLQNARIGLEKSRSLEERSAADLAVANWNVYRAVNPDGFAPQVARQLQVTLEPADGSANLP